MMLFEIVEHSNIIKVRISDLVPIEATFILVLILFMK